MDNVCCERLNVKLRNAEKHDCAIFWHILPLLLILMLQFKFRSTNKVHSSHVTVKWMHGQDESNRSVFYSACRCCQCWHVDRLFGFRSSVLPDKSGQNSSLAFSLHWSGRPHLSSGSKYSCSVFKERYKNMPWTRFPFTCVVSCSIGLGTEQKHGGFRQSCCEPGNKLIGNRLIWLIYQKMKMRQGICRTCWFSGAFRLQGSLNIWNAEGIMIKYELLTSTKWRNAIEFEDSTLFKTRRKRAFERKGSEFKPGSSTAVEIYWCRRWKVRMCSGAVALDTPCFWKQSYLQVAIDVLLPN